MDKIIKKWLEVSLPNVSSLHPVTAHLGDLVGGFETIIESVNKSTQAFNVLIEQLALLDMPVKPMLVIGLKPYSHKIEKRLPANIEELSKQIDHYESPSLYLIDWKPTKSIALCEELRIPLSTPWLAIHTDAYLYYREFRYGLAIRNNWEFSRAVYAEYYPEGIIIQ